MYGSLADILLIPFNLLGTTILNVCIPLIIFIFLLFITEKYLLPKFAPSKTTNLKFLVGIILITNLIPRYFTFISDLYGYPGIMLMGQSVTSDSIGIGWPSPILKYYFFLESVRFIPNYLVVDLITAIILFIIGFIYFGVEKELKKAN